ncbi:MAG: YfhO family protein, partial [Firmicutes bacterium]|nr:YfhO family protein [Bacillota bacterium]
MILFAAALVLLGVYPFGKYTIVCSDMEQQFLDLTAGIFNNIKSGKGLFVKYSGGMGVNLLAWSAYLLYDPLNILFLFFDVEYYQEVYLVIDILKYGFIALCASLYLKKSRYTALSGEFNIALAVLYAFGSFCLKSIINVMWLSNVAMLPIVLLAIERVIEKKKADLLFFSFLYCTATNFYLAFVTGLFSLMYFVFYYINVSYNNVSGNKNSKKQNLKDIFKSIAVCGITVALVGGICMAFIVPAWTNISGSYDKMFENDYLKNIIEWKPVYIAMFLTLIQPSAAIDDVIHGFFGIAPLFLAILFFFNTTINKKEKLCALLWIAIMLLSLMIRPLYLIWHVFREPTCFYGRFVYAIAFLFIMLSARSLKNISIKTRKLLALPFLVIFLTAFYAVSYKTNYNVLIQLCVITVLLLIYVSVFAAYIKNRSQKFAAGISVIIIAEALVMTVGGMSISKKYDGWSKRSAYFDDVRKTDRLLQNIEDDSFYRIVNVNRRSLNAALTSDYNALEVF